MKEIKINTWVTWQILSFIALIICWYKNELGSNYMYFYLIIGLLSQGFKSIDEHLGNETNLFKIKWSKK